MKSRIAAVYFVSLGLAWGAAGCPPRGASPPDRAGLERILEEDRAAHLRTDAALLASHLDDTLLSVDAGAITAQSRADLEAMFRGYFEDVVYRTWEDAEPLVIRVDPSGNMAWVIRKVRVEREEPTGDGARRSRSLVSAYTATYERRAGRWRMTTVTSTFLRPPG